MGNLNRFNLNEYIEKYNSEFLIETGTWRGAAVEYALNFKFKKIYSIELLKEFFDDCVEKFKKNDNVVLFNDTSPSALLKIFSENEIGNTVFWLDAHLPDQYDKTIQSNYKENDELLIPLKGELISIVNNKDISNDVFIMDDLRIYEKGSFKKGEWSKVIDSGHGGIEFVFELLGETHNIERLYDDEGYIICTPKNK